MASADLMGTFDWDRFERVVVLSPHLDDAPLSCGALLRALEGKAERLVVTLCAGDPPAAPSSPHRQRPGRYAAQSLRRQEDREAMRRLRCPAWQLGFLDCIDRRGPDGSFLYGVREAIFGPIHPDDAPHRTEAEAVVRRLCTGVGPTLLVSPMAIGRHVDHWLCARIALGLQAEVGDVLFYEDFPYVVDPDIGAGGHDDAPTALARLGMVPRSSVTVAVDVDDKVEVVGCYASQIGLLFGSWERMRERIGARIDAGRAVEMFWTAAPKAG